MSTNKPPGDPGTSKPQNKGVKRPARETDGNITVSSVSSGCAPDDEIQEIRIDDLPSAALNSSQKDWLRGHHGDFLKAKANKGTRNGKNGKKFVEGLIPEFLDEFYSSLDKDCRWRFSTVIHSKIYNFFNNFKAEDEEVVHHLKKMMPENLWYKECPSITDKAIEAYLSKNKGSKRNIGLFRKIQCAEWEKLEDRVRTRYKVLADEDKRKAEAAGPLTGEAQEQYYDKFLHKLHSLAKEGEKTAGIVLSAHIAYRKSTSSNISGLSIDSFCSKQISDYKKTRDHADSAMSFAAYLREEMDAPIVGQPPEPAIVPDRKDHNRPIIPAIDSNIRVPLACRLVRSTITAYWYDAGGIGPVPWAEIEDSVKSEDYEWIEKERLPDASKAPFKEPGRLKLSECLEWLVHLSKRQNGAPATERFQFQQVYAGTSPPPSWSRALQPSPQIQRGKHQVYLLRYEGFINQSQAAAGIPYHKSTWEWLAHLDGEGSLSQRWHGLPSRPLQEVREPLIGNREMDVIKEVFRACDDEVLNKVERLVRLVNEAKKYVPAMTPSGLWSEINSEVRPLPLLFPQTSPLNGDGVQYLLTFWMRKEYYRLATKSRDEGTMDFLEGWLEDSLTKGVTRHEQSRTFIGGPCGVVWVVRGLAKTLANVGACVGKIIPPIPAPESYELDRIGLPHWNRALKWFDQWGDALEDSNAILRESAAERLSPPEASQDDVGHTIDDDPDLQLHLPEQAASTENNAAAGKEAPTPQRRQQPDRLKKPGVVKSNRLVSARVTSEEEEASESEGSGGSDNFDPDVADEEEDEDDLEDEDESKEEIPMEASQKSTQAKAAKSTKRPRKRQRKSLTGNPVVSDDIEDQSVDLGASSSHSLPNIDYSARKNVFGAFATPKIFLLLTLELVPMVKHLESMLVMSKGLLVRWANGAESYRDPYCAAALNKARLVARQSNRSEPMKACVRVILLQRSVWSNARQSWPTVREYHQIMLNGFREIAMTMDCAGRLKKEHASSKPGPEYSLFLSHRGVLLARMYAIRFILEELKHLKAISTKWANQLQDAWERDFTQWEDSKLISLVKSMVEWRDETSKTLRVDEQLRQATWIEKKLARYEAEPTTSWYMFGNPGASCMVEEAIAAISAGNPPKDLQVDQPTPNLSQADSPSALPTDGILDNSSANDPTSLSRGPPPQADSRTDDSSVEDHTQQRESSPGQQDKLARALGEEPSSTVDTSTATPPDVGGARDNSDIVAEPSSGKGIGKGRSGGRGGRGGRGILCKQSGTTTCTDASTTEGSETGQSYFSLESMSGSSVRRSGRERHPSARAKGL